MAEHFAHVVRGSGPGILLAHGAGGSIAGNYGPILDFVPAGSPDHVDLVTAVDTRSDLPRVKAPTLVVATAEDGLTAPEHSRQLAAGIPDAELVEIAAGHSIAAEARDEWLSAIRSLLARVE
jgi:pimeloyl-ACP methyl ester carboxylesterase